MNIKDKKILKGLKRPNIVLIITDQQTWNPDYNKGFPERSPEEKEDFPAMKKLLKNSMTFQNAHCNTCTCTPGRTTLFTGTYPAHHGAKQVLAFDFPKQEKGYT
jgi:arylsulfatase A-like enzyme